MSDPIFQAPPMPAPATNNVTPPVQPTQGTVSSQPTQPVSQPVPPPVVPPIPGDSGSQSISATSTMPEQNNPASQNETQKTQAPVSAQNKVEELRQKLSQLKLDELKEKIQKRLWGVLGGCFLIGMMFGCSMGGGDSQPAQNRGLELSAITKKNSDIAPNRKLYRCGRTTQLSDACVYYIMNFDHYEKKAEGFFSEIADKTGRQLFRIQTENPTYGQQLIPPGYFAQIIVPSLN